MFGRGSQRIPVPVAESVFGEAFPREMRTGVDLPGRCDVRMPDEVSRGDVVGVLQCVEETEQAMNLRFRKGLAPIIIELDAQRYGVEVRYTAPLASAGVPSPYVIVEHLHNFAIAADHVMGTYLGVGCGKRAKRLLEAILGGVVNDDIIRLAQVEVYRPGPIRATFGMRVFRHDGHPGGVIGSNKPGRSVGQWRPQLFGERFQLFLVEAVGTGIAAGMAC